MAGTAPDASDDRSTCERCHGFVAIEVIEAKPRVRCHSCGHTRDLNEKTDKADQGKWTVVGPDGTSVTFSSWDELVASRRPSTITTVASTAPPTPSKAPPVPSRAPAQASIPSPEPSESKKLSAAALLDVTPRPPSQPTLALADETDVDVGDLVAAAKKAASEPKVKSAASLFAEAKNFIDVPAPGDSIEELEPNSLVDDHSDDEPEPISLRDVIPEEEGPKSTEAETISLADLVVVPAATPAARSVPPPTPRKTEPPPTKKHVATLRPPAPSLETATKADDGERKKTSKATAETKPAGKSSAEKTKRKAAAVSEPPPKPRSQVETVRPKDGRRAASARDTVAERETKKTGWLLPATGMAVVAVIAWRVLSPSEPPATKPPEPAPVTPATHTAQAEPTAAPTPSPAATKEAPPPQPPVEPSSTAAVRPSTTAAAPQPNTMGAPPAMGAVDPAGAGDKKPLPALSLSDALDRAAAARRGGDQATARQLYERILKDNPGNVEANGGLGDVERAQGNLAAAKTSYERALATSPGYGPAALGLADTEWEMGDQAGAQKHYAQIVDRLGRNAPERAQQRGGAAPAPPPAVTALPTATAPPETTKD